MPGYILTTSSQIKCMHGGSVILSTANTKLNVDNSPALLESDVHSIAGCPFTLPGPKPSPCIKVEWTLGAAMCKNNGTKVLVQSSIGKCSSPEGAPQGIAIVSQTQTKTMAM
jgi:hypothetical protein